MKEITIIAFNCGNAGRYVNGPGISLDNFVRILESNGIIVNLFTTMNSNFRKSKNLKKIHDVSQAIKRSDLLHHWSGLGPEFIIPIQYANKLKKPVIVGPNVLDTVELDRERNFFTVSPYRAG